MLQTLRDKL